MGAKNSRIKRIDKMPQTGPTNDRPEEKASCDEQFFIAGLGGSAGGFEAFEEFFENLPPDTGIGFVIVSHLDPAKKDILPQLMQRYTRMPVVQADNDMTVEPDHVYVIPPNKDMCISSGILKLQDPDHV